MLSQVDLLLIHHPTSPLCNSSDQIALTWAAMQVLRATQRLILALVGKQFWIVSQYLYVEDMDIVLVIPMWCILPRNEKSASWFYFCCHLCVSLEGYTTMVSTSQTCVTLGNDKLNEPFVGLRVHWRKISPEPSVCQILSPAIWMRWWMRQRQP